MSREPSPWTADLATSAGRQALEARVARAPAVLVDPADLGAEAPETLPPGCPHLVVGVAPAGGAAIVTLDHLVRPDAGNRAVLRRRLALLRVVDLEDQALEAAVFVWSILAREHAELVRERSRSLALVRRLVRELRP
jgi:hypothetical protein